MDSTEVVPCSHATCNSVSVAHCKFVVNVDARALLLGLARCSRLICIACACARSASAAAGRKEEGSDSININIAHEATLTELQVA